MPKEASRVRVISSRVRPPISTRALGLESVRGRSRVPRPAASTMAFMRRPGPSLPYGLGHRRLETRGLESEVAQPHLHPAAAAQAPGQLLGQENRAVLPAGASEGDHEVLEAPF